MYASDDTNILKNLTHFGAKLPIGWNMSLENVNKETRTFSLFPHDLVERVSKDEVVVHYHQWSVYE